MPRHDASNAECLVLTRKDGLLSAVAHDLKLSVGRFTIEREEEPPGLRCRFALDSLRVVCAMRDGADAPGVLSEKDMRQIEENAGDSLDTRRHAEAVFTASSIVSDGGVHHVAGTLALHGKERPVGFDVREEGGSFVAEVTLRQPDYGIKPFSAMMGTMKVHPEVRVRVRVPVGRDHSAKSA